MYGFDVPTRRVAAEVIFRNGPVACYRLWSMAEYDFDGTYCGQLWSWEADQPHFLTA